MSNQDQINKLRTDAREHLSQVSLIIEELTKLDATTAIIDIDCHLEDLLLG